MSGDGWFVDGDFEASRARVRTGTAAESADWPTEAVESGFAADRSAYYDALHEATVEATTAAVRERERADDQQLVHAIRALDDCRRTANELAERLAEWAGTVDPDAGSGIEYARSLTENEELGREVGGPIQSLAARVTDLADEADSLEAYVERRAPTVAPNLSALAGPLLAARLLSLAGGLETLAKKPSGTVQVLGAEEALFAHLRGHASSPKHGIIFTHEAVRGTRLEDRGSAARALAGKLTIAARIDHYSGDYRPELEAELADRIETIQARAEGDGGGDDE
ncbi:NOP5/NOP56 family protein [Natronosalvus rutilus]|uniref:NOP58 family protein n=1 Tax=Natronosalvus rutilus TaxID=2953753 RepID=A0A9E7SV06_9EURY|nr:NOP5/NOP56 family protein [Natronosalvus rutilus]UTF52526.1 NOP58 family protein [Natronosalvus rutilus]